jgi:hypothetical protein
MISVPPGICARLIAGFHPVRLWFLADSRDRCLIRARFGMVGFALIFLVLLTEGACSGEPVHLNQAFASVSPMVRFYEAFSRPDPDAGELAQLMENWAEADLAGALEWAASVPPGAVRDGVMSVIVNVWARRDPRAAWELLQTQITEPQALHETCQSLALQWGRQDLTAAYRWSKTLEGTMAEAARRGVTQALSASKVGGAQKR